MKISKAISFLLVLECTTVMARKPRYWQLTDEGKGDLDMCRDLIADDSSWGKHCLSKRRNPGVIFVAVVTTVAGVITIAKIGKSLYNWITKTEDQNTCITDIPVASPDGQYQACLTKSSQEEVCEPQHSHEKINDGLSQAIDYVAAQGLYAACLSIKYDDVDNEILMIKLVRGHTPACKLTCGAYTQIN